ncbi:4Fe-4S binding protein [Fibrobacterota bacterium]
MLFVIEPQAWAQRHSGGHGMGVLDVIMLPRIWVGALFCLAGLLLLKFVKIKQSLRVMSQVIIFIVFGMPAVFPLVDFARGMGMHPSPLCAITKPILFWRYDGTVPVIFLGIISFVFAFTIIGNKLFCGWACPLGAAQELMHALPMRRKRKHIIPFKFTNGIRILLFLAFLLGAFSAGLSIYTYFNPFEFFHWRFGTYSVIVMALVLMPSAFIFRPFCYLICPIGLLTWALESIAFARVKVDSAKCNDCMVCVKKSNCPAVPAIIESRGLRPDCHACGRCIELCPEEALEFK